MVLLKCVVVEEESMITIDIDESRTVPLLKDAIKAKKSNEIMIEADQLQLFLAKKKDGSWLDGAGAASVTLDQHGHPKGFDRMDNQLHRLTNAKCFGESFIPEEEDVHTVVVVREESQTSVLGQRSSRTRGDQSSQPSPKKPKLQKYVAFTGPVSGMDFSVPLDTTPSF
ncbi:hypothetical protein PRIC1_014686 [Phytophthora ramorum]